MIDMDYVTTSFWTMDMVMSFFTGFNVHGVIEMRLSKIIVAYLRGWFCVDLTILLMDWFFIAMTPANVNAIGFLRIGKTARITRIFRALRLLRFIRVWGVISEVLDLVHSQSVRAAFNILLAFAFIITITHYLACGWYLVGQIGMRNHWLNWIESNGLEGEEIIYKYTTSLHWSMTQFTPAGMEVRPYNNTERTYSIFVLLSAILTFSSFAGTISNAITQVRMLSNESAKQKNLLQKFFTQNTISVQLAREIWTYLKNNHFSKTRMHFEDVTVFGLLPDKLQFYLRQELYGPYLTRVPFFYSLTSLSMTFLADICNRTILEKSVLKGEELFRCRAVAHHVYVIVSGMMSYKHPIQELVTTVVSGHWVCEPVLWMTWKHCASMLSDTSCEVFALEAKGFRHLMSDNTKLFPFAKRYAAVFANSLHSAGIMGLTDIWMSVERLNEMVQTAWVETLRSSNTGLEKVRPPQFAHVRSLKTCSRLGLQCTSGL